MRECHKCALLHTQVNRFLCIIFVIDIIIYVQCYLSYLSKYIQLRWIDKRNHGVNEKQLSEIFKSYCYVKSVIWEITPYLGYFSIWVIVLNSYIHLYILSYLQIIYKLHVHIYYIIITFWPNCLYLKRELIMKWIYLYLYLLLFYFVTGPWNYYQYIDT